MINNASALKATVVEDISGFHVLPFSSSIKAEPFEVLETSNLIELSQTQHLSISKDTETGNFWIQRKPLSFEKAYLGSIAKYENEVREQYISNATQQLIDRLKFYNYDDETEELFWPVIDDIVTKFSISVLGSAFQSIIVKYNDFPNILCGVAKCLCSFDLPDTSSWGPMILISLLSHKSETVKEYAVMLLENWENRDLLPILRNIDCHATWLRGYINSVIANLEV